MVSDDGRRRRRGSAASARRPGCRSPAGARTARPSRRPPCPPPDARARPAVASSTRAGRARATRPRRRRRRRRAAPRRAAMSSRRVGTVDLVGDPGRRRRDLGAQLDALAARSRSPSASHRSRVPRRRTPRCRSAPATAHSVGVEALERAGHAGRAPQRRPGAAASSTCSQATTWPAGAHGSSSIAKRRVTWARSPGASVGRAGIGTSTSVGSPGAESQRRRASPAASSSPSTSPSTTAAEPRQVDEGVLVGAPRSTPRAASSAGRCTGWTTLASSSSAGCGRAVGGDEAVQAERAVVRLVAEVAAVREALGAVGQLAARAPGRPSPTRTRPAGRGGRGSPSQYSSRPPHELFIAWMYSHMISGSRRRRRAWPTSTMSSTAGYIGATTSVSAVAAVPGRRAGIGEAAWRQLLADAALVVDRPGRVARPQPRRGGRVGGGHAALVAERPDDDRTGGSCPACAMRADPLEHRPRPHAGPSSGSAGRRASRCSASSIDVHAEAVAHVVEVRRRSGSATCAPR